MKKKSYSVARPGEEAQVKGPSADLVDAESATEIGGRGFNLTEMTSDFDAVDPDIYDTYKFESSDKVFDKNIMDLLVSLGDGLDSSGEESLAGFADFLIGKFAQSRDLNYTQMFNQLMIKINNADIVNTNQVLKKINKIYSRTIVLEYMKSQDLNKSKESAYKKALHRADQYISEG